MDKLLEEIIYSKEPLSSNLDYVEQRYNYIGKVLGNKEYSIDTVYEVIDEVRINPHPYNSISLGLALSWIINNVEDKEVVLDTHNLEILYLLYKLDSKSVKVYHNIGSFLGCKASDSRIVVDFNEGDYLGHLSKKTFITIGENYGDRVGSKSEDLLLEIFADVGLETGFYSNNSTLLVKSNEAEGFGKGAVNSIISCHENYSLFFGEGVFNSVVLLKEDYGRFTGKKARESVFIVSDFYRYKFDSSFFEGDNTVLFVYDRELVKLSY